MRYAYKMFNKDLTCTHGRGTFQYIPGEWMEEKEANCVRNGFHSAENPLDCLSYYGSWDNSSCWLVEIDGSMDEDGLDTKIASTKIRLKRELSLFQFVLAAVTYIAKHPHLPENHYVIHTDGSSNANHFVICRGKGLKAKGQIGDVIAILEEDENGEITEAKIIEIDGEEYLPDVWYQADGEDAV